MIHDLHRLKRISSNFDKEILPIKDKFMETDHPLHFIDSVINERQKSKDHGDERFITPPDLLRITMELTKRCFLIVTSF